MTITKDDLKNMYKTMENKKICEKLGVSNATLISYLKKHDIPLKGKGRRNHKPKVTILVNDKK